MSDTVIRVENLGKLYRLGEIGTGTISHDINRWWARVRGKEDPFAKLGQLNDRTQEGDGDYVWALKDINFEVKRGEVLGIIGLNGAGKSTLLKILSKVTSPSKGKIVINGRIASLLEVGTGFHPELTGRENIYLNGAILGMSKAEIKSKFDEILAFSGVEKYIDTPVKRYSSGMYVRLAFSVAAHLECEIMVVDEVLAVGDMEFQKRCLEKMESVSHNSGRTVLYVSHILSSVRQLCNKALLLNKGTLQKHGNVEEVLSVYQSNVRIYQRWRWEGEMGDNEIVIRKTQIAGITGAEELFIQNELRISIELELFRRFDITGIMIGCNLINQWQASVAVFHTADYLTDHVFECGRHFIHFCIPSHFLASGFYQLDFNIGVANIKCLSRKDCSLYFELLSMNNIGDAYNSVNSIYYNSQVRPNIPVLIEKIK